MGTGRRLRPVWVSHTGSFLPPELPPDNAETDGMREKIAENHNILMDLSDAAAGSAR
jgi:hypothetical protein